MVAVLGDHLRGGGVVGWRRGPADEVLEHDDAGKREGAGAGQAGSDVADRAGHRPVRGGEVGGVEGGCFVHGVVLLSIEWNECLLT